MNYNRLLERPQFHDRHRPLPFHQHVPSAKMSSNTVNYGTVQQEKGKNMFSHITSRSSTDSTRSTDALVQKETKKDKSTSASAKAVLNSNRLLVFLTKVSLTWPSCTKELRPDGDVDDFTWAGDWCDGYIVRRWSQGWLLRSSAFLKQNLGISLALSLKQSSAPSLVFLLVYSS
jgi:hypothetical protein